MSDRVAHGSSGDLRGRENATVQVPEGNEREQG